MLQSQHHTGLLYTLLLKSVWFTLSQNFRSNLPPCAVLQSTLYTLKKNELVIC